MSKKKVAGSTLALAALLTSGALPAAHAIEVDTAPPELVSYTVTPSIVDARQGGTVKVVLHVKDDTCLAGSELLLTLSNAAGNSYSGFIRSTRVSGDCKDGVYEASTFISPSDLGTQPFGQWEMTLFPLEDTLGNSTFFFDRTFTYAASPDAVRNLQVTSATASTLSASWTASDTNGSPITRYVARIKNAAGTTLLTQSVTKPSLTDLGVALSVGQTYSLEVTSYNAVGGTETAKTTFVPQGTPVTPAAPVFTDESGTASDTYTIPDETGVQYYVNGVAVGAGTYSGSGTVTITSEAKTGYALSGTNSWTNTFATTVTVTPNAPVFTDQSGTASDTYTIPDETGVQYYVNGEAKAAGTYNGSGTVTITAQSKAGYTLSGTSSWTKIFAITVTLTPNAPVFTDKSGTAYDTYTIPAKTGVQYYANGVAKAAGTYKASGAVTITAQAKTGYALSGTSSWQKTFARTIVVTPTAATFTDKSGTTYDTYTLPAKTGVQYYANGVAKAAGTYKASGTVTITAKAKTGYALSGTTKWTRTFSKNIVITPTAPVFTDKTGTAYDRYTIPTKAGVQYYVNGVTKAAGTYKASGTVTVTARAKTGYALTGTTTWKRTFGR